MEVSKDPVTDGLSINDLEKDLQHINNPVVGLEPIVKRYLSEVEGYVQENNNFYFTDGNAKVEVRVVSDEIIRIRLAPQGVFLEEFSYAVEECDQSATVFKLYEDEEAYRVETNVVSCIIDKSTFLISFKDNIGKLINEDLKPMHWEENSDFGGYYVYATKKCQPEESFFGLGDKSSDLNLRGKRYLNWNTDAYSFAKGQDPLYRTVPFYIGINEGISYGIFFDNTFKSHFDTHCCMSL